MLCSSVDVLTMDVLINGGGRLQEYKLADIHIKPLEQQPLSVFELAFIFSVILSPSCILSWKLY